MRIFSRRLGSVAITLAVLFMACSSDAPSLVAAAIGKWACERPGDPDTPDEYESLRLEVTVGQDHTYSLVDPTADAEDLDFSMKGTWQFTGGQLTTTVSAAALGIEDTPFLDVTGIEQDAERLEIGRKAATQFGAKEDEIPGVLVSRQGYGVVTFRADEPGAVTWTCDKA